MPTEIGQIEVDESQAPLWLSPTADALSVCGFLLTLWVAFATNAIRKKFVRKGRLPQLRKSLSGSSKGLLTVLQATPVDGNAAAATLAIARSEVESLQEKLDGASAKTMKNLRRLLKGKRNGFLGRHVLNAYSENELWEIYHELEGVISAIKQLEKDAVWE